MNVAHLDEACFRTERLWQFQALAMPFQNKLKAILQYYRTFCKNKIQEYRATEHNPCSQLDQATIAINSDLNSAILYERHASIRAKFQSFESRKVAGLRIRSQIRWNLKGDRVTKEFFRGIREKATSVAITRLQAPDGTIVTEQAGLRNLYQEFYQFLYTTVPLTEVHEVAMQSFLTLIPHKFTMEAQEQLSRPLDNQELWAATEALVVGKSLGPDGVAIQFFTKFWDLIGEDFIAMFQQTFQHGYLPGQLNHGLITLLSKGRDGEILDNWCPITLLNVSYKVLAKALQRRLHPLLPNVISEDQLAFLPLIYILDNILNLHKMIHWVCELGQSMVLLKLDFQKAYDTVSHHFLFQVMHAFGILDYFYYQIQLLFTGAEASVHINGRATGSFPLQHEVYQGCFLALYLFLLLGETLNVATKKAVETGALQGIKLPKAVGNQVILQYVDDTSLMLAGTQRNLDNAIIILDLFHLESGLLINWTKSVTYWLSNELPPTWLSQTRCQWAVEYQL